MMPDNRPFKQKLLRRDPRFQDMTAKGQIISIVARIIFSLLGVALLATAFIRYRTYYLPLLLAYIAISSVVTYYLDQFLIKHWTFEAEKAKLNKKVAATKAEALKNR